MLVATLLELSVRFERDFGSEICDASGNVSRHKSDMRQLSLSSFLP